MTNGVTILITKEEWDNLDEDKREYVQLLVSEKYGQDINHLYDDDEE